MRSLTLVKTDPVESAWERYHALALEVENPALIADAFLAKEKTR